MMPREQLSSSVVLLESSWRFSFRFLKLDGWHTNVENIKGALCKQAILQLMRWELSWTQEVGPDPLLLIFLS